MALTITLVIAMASGVWATDTTSSVGATATVTAACQFGGSPSIDFGSGDADTGFAAATIIQPSLWCTNGYTAAVSDDGGENAAPLGPFKLKDAVSGDFITYNFSYTTAPAGLGKSTTNILTLSANIPTANIADVHAGTYTDTVVLTITY